MMTVAETIEHAQSSVDQIQRGLAIVQDNLERADEIAVRAEEFVGAAGELVVKARRVSTAVLIVGGLVVAGGVVAIVLIRRRGGSDRVRPDAEIVA